MEQIVPYLQANIAGGEGFGWYYASQADRASQVRTPITDGAQVFTALTPARSFNETSGATISDADFGGSATRKADAKFSTRVPLPVSPSDGFLFERGGSGTGMLLCIRDGGTLFRYRAGKGSVTAPGMEAAFLNVPIANMPFDGAEHELVWDVTLATGTIRLWWSNTHHDRPGGKAYTNYDNYVGVGTWTKIGINNTDYNDQGACRGGIEQSRGHPKRSYGLPFGAGG